jgi:hypothetical protein
MIGLELRIFSKVSSILLASQPHSQAGNRCAAFHFFLSAPNVESTWKACGRASRTAQGTLFGD